MFYHRHVPGEQANHGMIGSPMGNQGSADSMAAAGLSSEPLFCLLHTPLFYIWLSPSPLPYASWAITPSEEFHAFPKSGLWHS